MTVTIMMKEQTPVKVTGVLLFYFWCSIFRILVRSEVTCIQNRKTVSVKVEWDCDFATYKMKIRESRPPSLEIRFGLHFH